jgi:hypothetical protein
LSSDCFLFPQKSCPSLEKHFLKKEMQRRRSAFGSLADSWVIFLQIIFKMKSKICVGEICGTRQMNKLKERLKVGLVVILRDDVLGRPLHPPTATGGHPLAGGFDAQDDESVLTREFVLGQQFATTTAARLLLLLVGGRREAMREAAPPSVLASLDVQASQYESSWRSPLGPAPEGSVPSTYCPFVVKWQKETRSIGELCDVVEFRPTLSGKLQSIGSVNSPVH